MKKEIKIPDIAENVEKGLIAGVLVSKGDKVSKDQALVEIETDKATTDIPSDYDGVIDEIKVSEGDEVSVHQVIMIIEVKEGESEDTEGDKEKETEDDKPEDKPKEKKTDQKSVDEDKEETKKQTKSVSEQAELEDIPAAPSVRRLARELDIDL
ncbi:MAG: biotin/lipoyl-containing protein [Candidatus Theseobacter exili]|nr:biotin/lipoyl-containing protein [Candidatus Theseobacter exili]